MQDNVTELFWSKEPICAEGREFLVERGLSIPEATRKGVCSKDGVIYFLFTRNGEVVRWKGRSMKDKKKQFFSKLNLEDETSFQMPFFSHSTVPPLSYLIITEGEFDCIALSQLGASNCVSLPNGAASVETSFRNNFEFLQQFELIYIAFDMDKAGEEAAKKAMTLIPPSKYRRICFPCKDANDWLINYEPESKDLEALMLSAKKIESQNFLDIENVPDHYFKKIETGARSGWKKLDDMLGGFRKGEVTVLTADTGAGKSTFTINLFMSLASQGYKIWINSYEMDPRIVFRKMCSHILSKKIKFFTFSDSEIEQCKKWLKEKRCYINASTASVNINSLRSLFEIASIIYNIDYILLDHLDYIYAGGKKSSVLENIDEAMREIHVLAMEFKVGVILVAHPKQIPANEELTMAHIKGSSAIKQYADNIIILTRMSRKDHTDTRVNIYVCKNRLVGTEGSFFMNYIPEMDGYVETI